MPWFKLDDGLSMKAETTRIPRPSRTSAIGLLALAGSWSARELTDGHIPAHMLEELAGTEADAAWLVTAGFWIVIQDGWQFADWEPDQPLREVVLAERAKRAEKMRDWRSRNKPSNPVTDSPTDGASNPVTDSTVKDARPVPSRPDPDQSEKTLVQPAAHDDLEEFKEFWLVYPRKEGKADALKAYEVVRKKTPAAVILAGVRLYALANVGGDKQFVKLAAGWLRGQRWADEPVTRTEPAGTLDFSSTRSQRSGNTWSNTQGAGNIITPDVMCNFHPDYPIESAGLMAGKCTQCERTAGLAIGVEF